MTIKDEHLYHGAALQIAEDDEFTALGSGSRGVCWASPLARKLWNRLPRRSCGIQSDVSVVGQFEIQTGDSFGVGCPSLFISRVTISKALS